MDVTGNFGTRYHFMKKARKEKVNQMSLLDQACPVELPSNVVQWEEKGHSVEGVIKEIREIEGIQGTLAVYDLETAEGPATVIAGPAVLKFWFEQAGPRVGDQIAIIYTGDKGRLKQFSCAVERATYHQDIKEPAPEGDLPF